VLNESAQIMATMHFGVFGERQDTTNWQTTLTAGLYAPLNNITTRGFTGHEQVDDVGIIHMNGRIYDAKLGRFLQADPIVQAPKNTQNLNRYSYVLNNPLSYTDPSGYSFRDLLGIVQAVVRIFASDGYDIDAWRDLVESTKNLFDSPNRQQIVLPPGITVGSFTSQVSVPTRNPTGATSDEVTNGFTDVTTATVGRTYSEQTGGNFTNGAGTSAFSNGINANSTPSGEVVGNPKLDAEAQAVLSEVKSHRSRESGVAVMQNGTKVAPTVCSNDACDFDIDMSKVKFVVHRHVESNYPDSRHAKAITVRRELPGPGDHAFPVISNAPNYYESPTGAFRVLEFIGGKWRVRTISGPAVSPDWHPNDAIYEPRRRSERGGR
jgi:RHS repeat-associated protein